MIALAFGNLKIDETADKKMDSARAKYFPIGGGKSLYLSISKIAEDNEAPFTLLKYLLM